MDERLEIDADIRKAAALPPAVYLDPRWFERMKEQVFARSWLFLGDGAALSARGACLPTTLLEGFLDEPLLLVRGEEGALRCLSNVCTHRANAVCAEPGVHANLRCGYHGRRFALDGRCLSMPEF